MQGSHAQYHPPVIADYGTLTRMTASFHPFLAQVAGQDLSFSTPDPNTPIHGGVQSGGQSGTGGSDPSGSGGGSGNGGGGGGGGGHLPFTGLAVGAVAAVGSGLSAAGAALRRAVRERRGR